MNLMNNIPMLMGLGTGNILKSQAIATQQQGLPQGQQGLVGFLNLILQNMQGATGGLDAPANIGDLAAKISQILRANPTDTAGIEKLIQAFAPAATPELAAKIAEVIQSLGQPEQQAKPTLVSDLASLLAQDIQQQPSVEMQVANFLSEHAEQMSAQSGNKGLALGQADRKTALDQKILEALQTKFTDLQVMHGGEIKGDTGKEALLEFKADIVQFLQDQGLDASAIRQYLAAFSRSLREQAPEQVLMETPVTKAVEKADTKHSSFWQPAEGAEEAETLAPRVGAQDNASKPSPKNTQHLGVQNNMPAPQQPQPAQSAQKAPLATSNLALINSMAGGEGGFGSGEFGQHSSFSQTSSFDGAGLQKASGETNAQGFVNYMQAARGLQSPTTQMVGLQIQRNIAAKIDTFTLQLDPADLGRLDIRLKFDRDGGVKAHLTVERPETLALLQKDASHLERLLQQSGLDVDGGALSFDLREQGKQAHERNADGNAGDGDFAHEINGTEGAQPQTARIAVEAYGYVTQNSVNIMV